MSQIQIEVAAHGAELRQISRNGKQYMWYADKTFWGRVSPILFPVVGLPAGETLRIGGKSYEMHQHGFVRDQDFVQEGDKWIFRQAQPRENYPYPFQMEVRYPVQGNTVTCEWTVKNIGQDTMHFQIGAHPAFLLPDYKPQEKVHGYLQCFDHNGKALTPVTTTTLEGGLRIPTAPIELPNEDGLIVLTDDTFAKDAFLLEDSQVASVALLDRSKREVLRVSCPQAQAYGLWAPNKPNCPFVCIEPWCGIADRKGFTGSIDQRDYNHSLQPGQAFTFTFEIALA